MPRTRLIISLRLNVHSYSRTPHHEDGLSCRHGVNPHSLTIAELRSVSVHTTPQCPHKWQGLKVIQTAQTQQDSHHSFASYEQQGSAEEWTYSTPDPHRVRGGSWRLALKSSKVRWGWDLALPCSPIFLHTCKSINFILPITIPFLCSLI